MIKVSQAVSGEIVEDKLIATLMRTAIEQAGAQRGLLVLQNGGEQRIAAEAMISGETVDRPAAATSSLLRPPPIPETVLNYHARLRLLVPVVRGGSIDSRSFVRSHVRDAIALAKAHHHGVGAAMR